MKFIILSALKTIIKKLILASTSQAILEWLFFRLAEVLVKCTKNDLDDQALKMIQDEYFKQD